MHTIIMGSFGHTVSIKLRKLSRDRLIMQCMQFSSLFVVNKDPADNLRRVVIFTELQIAFNLRFDFTNVIFYGLWT